MTSFELALICCSVALAVFVAVVPRPARNGRRARVVVGLLAGAAGALVAVAGGSFLSPPAVVAGGLLLGAALSALAAATARPIPAGSVVVVAAAATAGLASLDVARVPEPPAAELAAAIAERAGVRDGGVIRGIAFGRRATGDLRPFGLGLAATDVDFAIALGSQPRPRALRALVERTEVPTIWVPSERDVALPYARELETEGVAVVRPAAHLAVVVVDWTGGALDRARREAIAAALESAGSGKSHVILALHGRPAPAGDHGGAMEDEEAAGWLVDHAREHGVDLVLSSTTGATAARRDRGVTLAAVGAPSSGRETLLRIEIDPRRVSLVPIERTVGPAVPLPWSARLVGLVAANHTPAWRRLLPALAVAALAAIPLLALQRRDGGGRVGPGGRTEALH